MQGIYPELAQGGLDLHFVPTCFNATGESSYKVINKEKIASSIKDVEEYPYFQDAGWTPDGDR
jgi:hypothetical protein